MLYHILFIFIVGVHEPTLIEFTSKKECETTKNNIINSSTQNIKTNMTITCIERKQ